jgi:hypothetical protein
MDFGDDEAEVVAVSRAEATPGRTGEGEIEAQLIELQTAIGDYWDEYKSGIELFRDSMQFASEQEAEPKYLNAIFTSLGKRRLIWRWTRLATRWVKWCQGRA